MTFSLRPFEGFDYTNAQLVYAIHTHQLDVELTRGKSYAHHQKVFVDCVESLRLAFDRINPRLCPVASVYIDGSKGKISVDGCIVYRRKYETRVTDIYRDIVHALAELEACLKYFVDIVCVITFQAGTTNIPVRKSVCVEKAQQK
jgi:hypothetical protein